MPILNDIMDHAVIGRERKRGIKIGMEQGLERGLEQGLEHERQVILRQIAKRFGPVPTAPRRHIAALSPSELERIALRLLDAASLQELLG